MVDTDRVPRIARVVAVGAPHHVTQRGNNRQQVFFSAVSRRTCLSLLGSHCRRWKLTLLGYCLMPNHVHLVAVPEQGQSLAKAVGRTNCEYAVYSTDGGGAAGMFGKIVSIQQVCEGMSAIA